MGRLLQKLIAVTALSGTCVVAAAACAENDSSLFIEGVLAPESPECTVTADPGQPMLGSGILDVAFSFEYQAWLLVGNQLTPRGRKNQLRAETGRVRLNGSIVSLTDEQGNELIDEFSFPGSGFVGVTTGEDAEYGALLATLVPPSIGAQLFDQLQDGSTALVVAKVRAFGETLGGQEIESADLSFPITVCYRCTVQFPADALVETDGTFACGAGDPAVPPPCFPGQGGIDCRSCAGLDICQP